MRLLEVGHGDEKATDASLYLIDDDAIVVSCASMRTRLQLEEEKGKLRVMLS